MNNLILNISPPKCGTTSLYFALVNAPQVAVSTLKEPRFFAGPAQESEEGMPDAMRIGGHYANGIGWHDALFTDKTDEQYLIDFTTYYAVTPDTPELVKAHYPDARLIMVLRDPVKRFVSHHYQYMKVGVPVPPIEEVIAGDGPVSRLMYDFADYRKTHERYARVFGEEAILMLDFRDLARNPEHISERCNTFFGLEDIDYAPSEREKNVAGQPRFKALQRMMFSNTVRGLFRGISPAFKTRLLTLRKRAILANVKPEDYPELPAPSLDRLTERLREQIEFYEKAF